MTTRSAAIFTLVASTAAIALPALAADVTPERLVNADKEPQNWLMNHRTYDGQRFLAARAHQPRQRQGLKLSYAAPLGGGAGNEFNEATPLARMASSTSTDFLGRTLQDRRAFRRRRPHRLAAWIPSRSASRRIAAAALWGNLVITPANHPARHDRDRQGDRQGRVGDQRRLRAARMNNTGARS